MPKKIDGDTYISKREVLQVIDPAGLTVSLTATMEDFEVIWRGRGYRLAGEAESPVEAQETAEVDEVETEAAPE